MFAPDDTNAIPLYIVSSDTWDSFRAGLTPFAHNWAQVSGFAAKAGQVLSVPDTDGQLGMAIIGAGTRNDHLRERFITGGASARLPQGNYRIETADGDLENITLGWLLQSYVFDKYKTKPRQAAQLVCPKPVNADHIRSIAEGEYLTRDIINTPASDMGPQDLEMQARDLAARHNAAVNVICGDDLHRNFPLIHAVGRASDRAPRLIDVRWGNSGPALTVVGKGVCFDTGGLNLKPGASMGLMKKDLGGAATALGLAHMIMSQGLPLRLRVLIPAVENAVSGNAFRPGDVLTSRKGLTIEVNNTDAEGRLVLADALDYACKENPDLIVSLATLTGAARVAVGPDLAPYYTDDDRFATALNTAAAQVSDPVWRMPFYAPYESKIEPQIADLDNAPAGGMAGSITAALFLKRFVDRPYAHFDIYGWQSSAAPGRPVGGCGQASRALLQSLPDYFAKNL